MEHIYLQIFNPLMQERMSEKSYIGEKCTGSINNLIKRISKLEEQKIIYNKLKIVELENE